MRLVSIKDNASRRKKTTLIYNGLGLRYVSKKDALSRD